MKILGIDTSSKSSSCAIVEDGKILAEYFVNASFQHSKTLMPMIESLLSSLEISASDIDAIGVTVGPGSFTGVRIGVSAAKGIGFSSDIPCVETSSLEVAAMNCCSFDGIICSIMDARCNQFYNALFLSGTHCFDRLCDDRVCSFEELEEQLSACKKPIVLVGDGAELFAEKLGDKISDIVISSQSNRYPKASNVAMLSYEKMNNGEFIKSEDLEPLYLRLPQAVRNLKK